MGVEEQKELVSCLEAFGISVGCMRFKGFFKDLSRNEVEPLVENSRFVSHVSVRSSLFIVIFVECAMREFF